MYVYEFVSCVNHFTESLTHRSPIVCIMLHTQFMSTLYVCVMFHRYQIINPGGIVGVADIKKQSQLILEATPLDPDMYRIGHTKAWHFSSIINIYNFKSSWSSLSLFFFYSYPQPLYKK